MTAAQHLFCTDSAPLLWARSRTLRTFGPHGDRAPNGGAGESDEQCTVKETVTVAVTRNSCVIT